MKAIKYIKRFKEAVMLPYGVDTQFDEDCDNSFLRLLDFIYYVGITFYVTYAAILLTFLLT